MNTKSCIVVLLAALSCGLAKGDTLNYTVTSGGRAGQQLYQLTLSNTGTTGGALFDLFVSVPIGISDLKTGTIGAAPG